MEWGERGEKEREREKRKERESTVGLQYECWQSPWSADQHVKVLQRLLNRTWQSQPARVVCTTGAQLEHVHDSNMLFLHDWRRFACSVGAYQQVFFASELSRKFIKSALLVGLQQQYRKTGEDCDYSTGGVFQLQ